MACVASWSDGDTHYLLGQLTGYNYGGPQYRCHIYEEKPGENYLYSMTRTSAHCGAYSSDYEYFYRIYNESVGRSWNMSSVFRLHAAENLERLQL